MISNDVLEEMCHLTPPASPEPPINASTQADHALEINDLRGRLDRRNALLDAIRKAYHRDVVVVKEYLIEAEKRGLVSPSESGGCPLTSLLASLPSVDLRKTFRLFAPQECEMRVHPCSSCGGQLEIIHRESSRIVEFKHSIQLLEEKERNIRLELIETKASAKDDRERLIAVMSRCKEEREILLEQIHSLKLQCADRNALDEEVKRLKVEKGHLEVKLESQEPILVHYEQLKVEIELAREEARQWESKYRQEVDSNEKLQQERESLDQQLQHLSTKHEELRQDLESSTSECQKLEATCSTISNELSKTKTTVNDLEVCLQKAENAVNELESESEKQKRKMEDELKKMESKCSDLEMNVSDLNEMVSKKSEEADYYRKKIEATLEGARRRGSITSVPRCSDAAFAKTDELLRETEILRQKAAALSNLLLSCIRTSYDNCLIQERMLHNNGYELHRNNRLLKAGPRTSNEKAKSVLEHLGNADESDAIEWASILLDETDQRHIMGNLQNRMQMGQFSLEKCFDKIHKSHTIEMDKCKEGHRKQIEEKVSRIWELEKFLTEAIAVNRNYEDKINGIQERHDHLQPAVEHIRRSLRVLSRECHTNHDTTLGLKEDYFNLRTVTERLLNQLNGCKEKNRMLETSMVEKQEDIDARDKVIEQLEHLLEKITQKYAASMIRNTSDAAVQAVAEVSDAESHADFLFAPSRGVTAASEDKKKGDAPLQGHIWPSFIDVGSKIQFRRTIDKL